MEMLLDLDELEIVKEVDTGLPCGACESPLNEIDESLVTLIPKQLGGSLVDFFTKWSSLKTRDTFIGADGPVTVRATVGGFPAIDCYEIRHYLVKSGLFTRTQLSKYGLFSEHELEVNDRQFDHIRPHQCSCVDLDLIELDDESWNLSQVPNYDSEWIGNADDGLSSAEVLAQLIGKKEVDVSDPPIDQEFVSGIPVRTGFRRRSKAASIRRKNKRRTSGTFNCSTKYKLLNVYPSLEVVDLKFLYRPRKGRDSVKSESLVKKRKRFGKTKPNHSLGYTKVYIPLSKVDNNRKKYAYFFRKRGEVYLSLHHPLPG